MPVWRKIPLPLVVAMPLLSWPRCWRANKAKKVSLATSSLGAYTPKMPQDSCKLTLLFPCL